MTDRFAMNHFALTGRLAIVTGGGGALCGAMARGLAAAGASVAVWDLSAEAAERTAAEVRAQGGRAQAFACDVLNQDQVATSVLRTEEALGPIDILINGAGGSRKTATTSANLPFMKLLPEDLMSTLALNYLSAVLPSQAVAPRFVERSSGVILNIASIAGMRPLTQAIAYSNGKAALISFTQWLAVHMAKEYSPLIRVNALAPGFVQTEQNRFLLEEAETGSPTDRGRQILKTVPMGRYGTAEEMVGAAVWLVSDAARYVTGAVIPVDGGFSAYPGV